MSNNYAIVNVTQALSKRLYDPLNAAGINNFEVTTTPPDVANKNDNKNRLNVFLYHVVPSAAWRNQMDPQRVKPGETGYPPLGLSLHYIITAFGLNGDDTVAHRMLALGMSALHDQPLFSPAELKAATAASDLNNQIERVRITSQPLTTEEMYKLWSAFQTTYRVSAAYEVSVVLIDTTRPVKAPLPVITVASGNGAQTDLVSPYPVLTAITPGSLQDYVVLGDALTLKGTLLNTGSGVTVRFKHRLLTTPIDVNATSVTATSATVTLPALSPASSTWPAGIYTVSAIINNANPALVRMTNEVPLILAPKITSVPSSPVIRNGQGIATLPIGMSPQVWPGQSVSLLVGSLAIAAPTPVAKVSSISFSGATAAGPFYFRLRIDGIDSPIVMNTPVPTFDPTLKVTIQ